MSEESIQPERTEPQFIREIPSNTKAIGFHIKWKNQHYYVSIADHGRYGTFSAAFHSSNRGKPDFKRQIFCIQGNDSDYAIDYLLDILHGEAEAKIMPIYR
jgi:hypothetical protein